jgi:hypothetical protein
MITIKKMANKSRFLAIVRKDKNITRSKLHRGLETHGLVHSVETTLKFNKAFYSLIKK